MAAWTVEFRPEVEKDDLPKLPRNLLNRIFRAIESRLMTEPSRYGRRLRRSLSDLWKMRVGDYRVVYEIRGAAVTIWAVSHRKEVYGAVAKRRKA